MTDNNTPKKTVTVALLLLCFFVGCSNGFTATPALTTTTKKPVIALHSVSLDPKHDGGYDTSLLAESDLAGNLGFDPLHIAQSKEQLFTYRQAEMKHSRLAMFSVLMWMWQDLEVVNGLKAIPEVVGACVGLSFALELYGMKEVQEEHHAKEYFPGNLGMDPFHLYPADEKGQRRMQFAEIMMGRMSMLMAAVIVTQEALSFLPVFQAAREAAGDVIV